MIEDVISRLRAVVDDCERAKRVGSPVWIDRDQLAADIAALKPLPELEELLERMRRREPLMYGNDGAQEDPGQRWG